MLRRRIKNNSGSNFVYDALPIKMTHYRWCVIFICCFVSPSMGFAPGSLHTALLWWSVEKNSRNYRGV